MPAKAPSFTFIRNPKCPYIMDMAISKGKNKVLFPEISKKNADFVDGILLYDTKYCKSLNALAEGSIAYWFNAMKYPMKYHHSFDDCLKMAIAVIDKTNSTHLTASINGRSKMYDFITKDCGCTTVGLLKNKLNSDIASGSIILGKGSLIEVLSRDIPAIKGGMRSNLSFASKFCAYADLHLNKHNDRYSKYDTVVAGYLKNYIDLYLHGKIGGEKVLVSSYKYSSTDKASAPSASGYIVGRYNRYLECIGKIIAEANKSIGRSIINRNRFDRIVWYYFK